jgi:hypothetical protein
MDPKTTAEEPLPTVPRFPEEWKFSGASDDLVHVTHTYVSPFTKKLVNEEEEYNVSDDIPAFTALLVDDDRSADPRVKVGDIRQGLKVLGFYLPGGVWSFMIAQIAANVPLPGRGWANNVHQAEHCEYSAELSITTPPGVRLVMVYPER